MNLLDTLDLDSSRVYIRRVLARALGHAIGEGSLSWADAAVLWLAAGHDLDQWDRALPVAERVAYGRERAGF